MIYPKLRFVKRVFFALLTFTNILIGGCAQTYNEVSFCWTTNHRIPPSERIISVNASPEATKNAITKWVDIKKGMILTDEEDYDKIITLTPDSMQNFLLANNFAKKQWESYDKNEYKKTDQEEWKKFIAASESQIKENPSNDKGYRLFARVGDKDEKFNVRKAVGTKVKHFPGFFLNGVWHQPPPMPFTEYKTVTQTLTFYSVIRFYIFVNEDKTYIYADALPGAGEYVAKYGNSIGYKWHSNINAKKEEALITEFLNYIKGL